MCAYLYIFIHIIIYNVLYCFLKLTEAIIKKRFSFTVSLQNIFRMGHKKLNQYVYFFFKYLELPTFFKNIK